MQKLREKHSYNKTQSVLRHLALRLQSRESTKDYAVAIDSLCSAGRTADDGYNDASLWFLEFNF